MTAVAEEFEEFAVAGGPSLAGLALVGSDSSLPALSIGQLRFRRVLDLVLAIVGCVVLTIPMLVIAAVVAATSPGPALFRQTRVGRHGVHFTVYKFRTMRNGTDREVRECETTLEAYRNNDFKLPADDPRITPIGRFLRKTSLDELPQILNVLKGDMSCIGNRPLLDDELARRSTRDQDLYRMLRPGMTGLWQVEGRSSVAHDDRYELDRRYIEEWSLLGDLKILLRTPMALLRTAHAH